jgi:hypothetical protein
MLNILSFSNYLKTRRVDFQMTKFFLHNSKNLILYLRTGGHTYSSRFSTMLYKFTRPLNLSAFGWS